MSEFADQFARDAVPGLLGQFGQQALYQPRAGGPPQTVSVLVVDDTRDQVSAEMGDEERELVWVEVSRDPDSAYGAIPRPCLEDALVLEDDQRDPWYFQGRVRRRSSERWQLQFGRVRPARYGPK